MCGGFFKAHVKGHKTFLTNLDIGDQWMRTFLTCSHRMNENQLQANQHQFYWIPRQSVNVSWYIYSDYTYQYFMGTYLSLCAYVNPVWNYTVAVYSWSIANNFFIGFYCRCIEILCACKIANYSRSDSILQFGIKSVDIYSRRLLQSC